MSVGRLHIVLISQTVKSCLCYVHSPRRDMFRVVGNVRLWKISLHFLQFLFIQSFLLATVLVGFSVGGFMSSWKYKSSSAVKAVSPRLPSCLHHVGERHVVGPHVVLPLAQPQHPTQHPPCVDADPHVELDVCSIHHRPENVGRCSWTFMQTL